MCNSFRGASDVRYSRCRNRARVGLSVGISVTVSVPSNKVRVVTQPYNIRVAHKPITTLRELLTNVKDTDKLEDRQGVPVLKFLQRLALDFPYICL